LNVAIFAYGHFYGHGQIYGHRWEFPIFVLNFHFLLIIIVEHIKKPNPLPFYIFTPKLPHRGQGWASTLRVMGAQTANKDSVVWQ